MHPITPTPEQWDSFVRAQSRAHFLQLSGWGTLKSTYGWKAARVAFANDQGDLIAGAQLLFRPLPLRLGTLAYLPMGPYHTAEFSSERGYPLLWKAIHQTAKQHHAAFLKWEPGIFEAEPPYPVPSDIGFRTSPQTVQPPRTILLDIRGTDDEILARMNQGTRRKIRQSLKNDIRYFEGTREDVAKFNGMMQTTGARNEFGVHEPAYYERAYDLFVPQGDAALFLAAHEGDDLAGIMVFISGTTAQYVYGASSNVKRNLMGAYGVQWAAIQWARARGCTTYDLWGIPDEDEATLEAQFESRSDSLWGVYGFKRGWGGRVVRSLGAWDYVYNPLVYAAYRATLKYRQSAE
jgi:peptidoglycan pentaglycine glycine transferase (the first glycine)